jgi:hypothetical protein
MIMRIGTPVMRTRKSSTSGDADEITNCGCPLAATLVTGRDRTVRLHGKQGRLDG